MTGRTMRAAVSVAFACLIGGSPVARASSPRRLPFRAPADAFSAQSHTKSRSARARRSGGRIGQASFGCSKIFFRTLAILS